MLPLMIVMSLQELKLEEEVLSEEYGYNSIPQARNEFRHLVLTRMRKEVKLLRVNLKQSVLSG